MDKDTYETYEFHLPANSTANESDQFFVVQDDGTFLINRQVQYVTQVEEEKEVLDGVQVYDVTPQQFFVDIDNSSGLIAVPDNYILPDNENNLYGNSFLLQTDASTGQIEDVVVDQYKPTELQVDNEELSNSEKQNGSCTEITLSDDQYNMLEQKGWILLETNDKTYILDTLGLHDVTTNHELIKQLKVEIESSKNSEVESRSSCTIKLENIAIQDSCNQQDGVELVIENSTQQYENKTSVIPFMGKEIEAGLNVKQEDKEPKLDNKPTNNEDYHQQKVQITQRDSSTVNIKTKFPLKDIPDKIVLGKTVNGKVLIAKVVRTKFNKISDNNDSEKMKCKLGTELTPENKTVKTLATTPPTGLFEWQFESLVKKAVQGDAEVASSPELVSSVGVIFAQLLHEPALQTSLTERNLVITKVVKKKHENDSSKIGEDITPSFVTGRLLSVDGQWKFEHVPDLLQKLTADTEEFFKTSVVQCKPDVVQKPDVDVKHCPPKMPENLSVLHVHIAETKCADKVETISITLNKRQLPKVRSRILGVKKRQFTKIYACSCCAKIFQSGKELTEHHESQCMDTEGRLTIDTDRITKESEVQDSVKLNTYYTVKTNKGTLYACLHCPLRFYKLTNCLRHVKTHNSRKEHSDKETKHSLKEMEPKYKCRMCTSCYYHSSTLSKHILSAHIKVRS